MGVFGSVTRAMRGLAIVLRTVWFAGILLLLLLGLLAIRMVSSPAAASNDDEATSALTQIIPGENTLSEADRRVIAPDAEDTSLLPVESSAVRAARAEYRPSAIMHRHAGSPAKAVAAKPRNTGTKTTNTGDVKLCRQLDPIARFLVSANLAARCAG